MKKYDKFLNCESRYKTHVCLIDYYMKLNKLTTILYEIK